MAAYAALTSLLGTTKQLSDVSGLQKEHKQHLKLIYEEFVSLQESLDGEPTKDLQARIKDIALQVEDEVESLGKQLMELDERLRFQLSEKLCKIRQQSIQEIDSFREQLIKPKKNNFLQAGSSSTGNYISPRSDFSILEVDMVGRTIEKKRIIGQLTRGSGHREVISVSGMGGIGKSTFAKSIFLRLLTKRQFQICGWITVSEKCNFVKMLRVLLKDAIGMKDEALENKSEGELAGLLKIFLRKAKYLIVVDDIWSEDDWDRIKQWFPEDCGEKSRILLTSRDDKVAKYASSLSTCLEMRPLEADESWKLFDRKAFAKSDNHPQGEFEKVGKEVVAKCHGLPLMIIVVAGILSSKTTLNEWKNVAQSVSSLVSDDAYQQCLGVLSLSYHQLPSHLKASFLHFGVFPKASAISVTKLNRLWVAEGLLKFNTDKELEAVAAKVLRDLIEKGLVILDKQSSLDGKIKTCRIHDLFHDFCSREAESENLLYATSDLTFSEAGRYFHEGHTWVSIHSSPSVWPRRPLDYNIDTPFGHPSERFDCSTQSKTRSLYFTCKQHFSISDHLKPFPVKQLRVFDMEEFVFVDFPSEILELGCLRYLALSIAMFPEYLELSNLWNLQTLIIRSPPRKLYPTYIPATWEMSRLRHLHLPAIYIGYPRSVLENLQSVSRLCASCCTKEALEGIKRVKKLRICFLAMNFGNHPISLDDLTCLQELDELCIEIGSWYSVPCVRFTGADSFPRNLKKLKLKLTALPWDVMAIISKLRNLEVLKLKLFAFEGDEWQVTEKGFEKLKFLLLDCLNFKCWRSNSDDHFPCLERVIIRNCLFLKEIPTGFEDSTTLELIELYKCTTSLVVLAEEIQKQQAKFGKSKLKVNAFNTRSPSDED